jgi:hypothetical protein
LGRFFAPNSGLLVRFFHDGPKAGPATLRGVVVVLLLTLLPRIEASNDAEVDRSGVLWKGVGADKALTEAGS